MKETDPRATERTGEASCGRIDASGIEAHADTLGQLYELEFNQVDAGSPSIGIDFVATPSCVLYREYYGARTHALGSLRGERFAFAVPIRDPATRWWGEERCANLTPSSLSGEVIDAFFMSGHAHFIAVIGQRRLLAALHEARCPRETIRSIEAGRRSRMLEFHGETMDRLAVVFAGLLDNAIMGQSRLGADRLDSIILDAAMCLLDPPELRSDQPRAGAALFRRAVHLYEDLGTHPNIATLCTALNVRPRTLEAAFQSCCGITPHRFFAVRRLNRARKLLTKARQEEHSVTDVALSLGITELGRFAVTYRKLFGEKPSETLKHKPQTVVAIPF
jgi:AraC family ethanolamine operon transcriptional activator